MAWKGQKKWLRENKERVKATHLKWIENNRERYDTWNKEYKKQYRELHKEQIEANNRLRVLYDKLLAFDYYSNGSMCCAICGESRIECLSIDHINGGGTKHRKEERIKSMAEWLRKHGYPPGYRILCMNCQFIEYRSRP